MLFRPRFLAPHEDVTYWQRAVSSDPANSNKRILLAFALRDAHRFAEAEAELREAVRLNPVNAGANFELATFLCKRGDPAGARVLLIKIITMESGRETNNSKSWIDKARKSLKVCGTVSP
jgi:Flp pilus assembly protein TadD